MSMVKIRLVGAKGYQRRSDIYVAGKVYVVSQQKAEELLEQTNISNERFFEMIGLASPEEMKAVAPVAEKKTTKVKVGGRRGRPPASRAATEETDSAEDEAQQLQGTAL